MSLRIAIAALVIIGLSCKKKEKNSSSGQPATASSNTASELTLSSVSLVSGSEFPLVGQTKVFRIEVNSIGVSGHSELPKYLSYTGPDNRFPGENGTCDAALEEGVCSIEMQFKPTAPINATIAYELQSDTNTLSIPLEFKSRYVFGYSDYETDNFYEKNFSMTGSVLTVNNKFVYSDNENNRVLIWDGVPQTGDSPDIVLGQPDFKSIAPNAFGISANSMSSPNAIASDGTRLIVADNGNLRLLIWTSFPTSTHQPADIVIGQPDFETVIPLDIDNPVANRFGLSYGLSFDANKLFVADNKNNRVLGWSTFPTTNDQVPDIVLGQADFISNQSNRGLTNPTRQTIGSPHGVHVKDGKLYVGDSYNRRVLVWDSIPSPADNDIAKQPDYVLGQDSFTERHLNSNGSSDNSPSASSFNYPTTLAVASGYLYVMDLGNHRVTGFNITNFASPPTMLAAEYIVGQDTASAIDPNKGSNVSSTSLHSPINLSSDGTNLSLLDVGNTRILHWTTAPTSNTSATAIFGQANFTSTQSKIFPTSESALYSPSDVYVSDSLSLIADTKNNRILGWNSYPLDSPDFVIGQDNFISDSANKGLTSLTQATLKQPKAIDLIGEKIFVGDERNARYLLFDANTLSQSNTLPEFVFGKPNFTTTSSSSSNVNLRSGISSCAIGSRLYFSDRQSRVVSISNTPTSNGEAMEFALGQPGLFTVDVNSGSSVGPDTLNRPIGIACSTDKLFVADTNNNRVLIWNNAPTSMQEPADLVLGQPDLLSATWNNGGTSSKSLAFPSDVIVSSDGRLLIIDSGNNRVLIWDKIPETNFVDADHVIGQLDFVSRSPGYGFDQLQSPAKGNIYNGSIFIADSANNRVIGIPLPPKIQSE